MNMKKEADLKDHVGGNNDIYSAYTQMWQLAKRHNDKSIELFGNKTSRRYVKPSSKRIPLL